MNRIQSYIFPFCALIFAQSGISEVVPKKETPTKIHVQRVYEDGNDVVIVTDTGVRRINGKDRITTNSSYEIMVENRPVEYKDLTSDEYIRQKKAKVSRLLFEAQNLFKRSQFSESWSLVDQAEKLSPRNPKVLVMKGSLLYRAKSTELALQYYEAALKIDPSQSQVKVLIGKLKSAREATSNVQK